MKAEIRKAVAPLGVMYPNIDNTKLDMYAALLSDIHPVTLKEAVMLTIQTHEFVPSVATIRNKASEISAYVNCKEKRMPAQSAWAIVRKRGSNPGYERGLEGLEGVMLQAAKAVWELFNPHNRDFNESAAMSQFCKVYERLETREQKRQEVAEVVKRNALLREARKNAEINSAQKIKMLDNGHLIETDSIISTVETANISEDDKKKILGVMK